MTLISIKNMRKNNIHDEGYVSDDDVKMDDLDPEKEEEEENEENEDLDDEEDGEDDLE
ncbi:MAG: hypothetical protein HYV54_00715 [Parcubacteria group bacterium]|nr:hypothetical protein [Parcubacteria group bacterium]